MEQMRIKVDTAVLAGRADTAEKKINEVRERFERIQEVVNRSRNYWEGKASDAHRREYQEYRDEIAEILSRFQENVTDLRKIAGVYEESERAIETLAQDLPIDVIV